MAKDEGGRTRARRRSIAWGALASGLLLTGHWSPAVTGAPTTGPELVLGSSETREYIGASLAVDGNVTVGPGASLLLHSTSLSLSSAGASVVLGPLATLALLNGSRLAGAFPFEVRLGAGSRLALDRSAIDGAAVFEVQDGQVRLNLSTVENGGPLTLLGASDLLAANSSFANLVPVALELRDNALAEVRGLAAPAYTVGPSSRLVLSTYASVEVRDASGKALASAEWAVESNGTTLGGTAAFGGTAPTTRVNHRGFAEPQWVAVPQLIDEGGSLSHPFAGAQASYGSWNGAAAVNTSGVSTALFVATPPGAALEDASLAAGLDAGRGWMAGDPTLSQGPGAAWGDFDGDGAVDVAVTAAPEAEALALAARGLRPEDAPAPLLFLGRGDGTFAPANGTGLESARGATGLAAADFDNDGDSDLFVARYGVAGWLSLSSTEGEYVYHEGQGLGGLLMRNDGRAKFTDVTGPSGIALDGRHTVGGAWGDFDRDGCIDLFALNMGEILFPPPAPSGSSAAGFADNLIRNESDSLWRNNCDGTFSDVTESAGRVTAGGEPGGRGALQRLVRVPEEEYFVGNLSGLSEEGSGISYAALWIDIEGDGDLDLFVADDFGASPLYLNRGDGTFALGTRAAGLLKVGSAMSFTPADFDRDGDLDIFQTNFNRDFLWVSNGDGTFEERADAWGIPEVAVGWGARAEDLDLDGFPDLAVATGAMSMGLKASERSVLYLNDGGRRFVDVSAPSGFDGPGIGISLTSADANRDGRADLLLGRVNESNSFFLNREPGGGSVRLALQGTTSPTFGEGAQVTATVGGRPLRSAFAPGGEYASSSEPLLILGLGGAPRAERVTVWWPSGAVQALGDLPAGAFATAVEPAWPLADAGPDRTVALGGNGSLKGRVLGLPAASYALSWAIEGGADSPLRLADGADLPPLVPGVHLAVLEVRGRYGDLLASDAARVTVLDLAAPTAAARLASVDGSRRVVELSAADSRDGDPRLATHGAFRWVLVQGAVSVRAEGREVRVVLPSAGAWSAHLTVADPSGNEAATSLTFDLGAAAGEPPSTAAVGLAALGTAGLALAAFGLVLRAAGGPTAPPPSPPPPGPASARASRRAHPKARLR